jgi:hypothetical protein
MATGSSGEAPSSRSSLATKIGSLTAILVAATTLLTTIEVLIQHGSSFTCALGRFSWCHSPLPHPDREEAEFKQELAALDKEIAKLQTQLDEARKTSNPSATEQLQKNLANFQNRKREIETQAHKGT